MNLRGTVLFQVKKHRVLFLRFTHDDPKAQKYLIGGIEQVIALHKDSLMSKVPHIFKVSGCFSLWVEVANRRWDYLFVLYSRLMDGKQVRGIYLEEIVFPGTRINSRRFVVLKILEFFARNNFSLIKPAEISSVK